MPITEETYWYVLRDLKRPNSLHPAYLALQDEKFRLQDKLFIPMKQKVCSRQGKKEVKYVPYMNDLIFIHERREVLDAILDEVTSLQYRYVKGGRQNEPMKVRHADMERFIQAVLSADRVEYYSPQEVSPQLYGKHIRIIGGRLDGFEGRLLTQRGSRKKRLIVDLPGFLSATIEVNPAYIQLLKE